MDENHYSASQPANHSNARIPGNGGQVQPLQTTYYGHCPIPNCSNGPGSNVQLVTLPSRSPTAMNPAICKTCATEVLRQVHDARQQQQQQRGDIPQENPGTAGHHSNVTEHSLGFGHRALFTSRQLGRLIRAKNFYMNQF